MDLFCTPFPRRELGKLWASEKETRSMSAVTVGRNGQEQIEHCKLNPCLFEVAFGGIAPI